MDVRYIDTAPGIVKGSWVRSMRSHTQKDVYVHWDGFCTFKFKNLVRITCEQNTR